MSPARPARSNALLILLGLIVAAVLLETGLRAYFRRESIRTTVLKGDAFYYVDVTGRRRLIPGSVAKGPSYDGKGVVEYRVNSLGFLDDPLAPSKPAGEKRVLFLGDSIVMGGGIAHDRTFVERAESILGVEVINAGVGDVGLGETLALLEETAAAADPDLVVLGVYLNDSRPPQGFRDEILFDSRVVQALRNNDLFRNSYLVNFVVYSLNKGRVLTQAGRATRRFAWIPRYEKKTWLENEAALRGLVSAARYDWGAAWNQAEMAVLIEGIEAHRKFCLKRGLGFAVVLFPVDVQLKTRVQWKNLKTPQNALRSYLHTAGVPYLDMLDVLSTENAEDDFYDHCHLTPEGHARAAEGIAPFLRGLLAKPQPPHA